MFQGAKGVMKQSVLRSKVFRGVKCSLKQSVLRSKVFWGAECAEKQVVMRSKGFWIAKGVKEQGVLRSKLWLCHVCLAAKCVKLLRSKVFLMSKVFFEAKCAPAKKNLSTIAYKYPQRILERLIKLITYSKDSMIDTPFQF